MDVLKVNLHDMTEGAVEPSFDTYIKCQEWYILLCLFLQER
jgi:hypothetical protein